LEVLSGALKMTDMKMQDMKLQDRKYSVNRDYISRYSVQFLVVVIFLDTNTLMHCA